MFWESSGVVRFDLGPLLEGQMRTAKLKSAYNSLIIGPRGFGALSLRWIQFASVLRCARSSYIFQFVGMNSDRFSQMHPHYTSTEVSALVPYYRENCFHNCNPHL